MVGVRFSLVKAIFYVFVVSVIFCYPILALDLIDPHEETCVDFNVTHNDYQVTGAIANSNWSTEFTLPGFNNSVTSITEFNGELYACGYFSTINNIYAPGLAKWDGDQWVPIINNFDGSSIQRMRVYNNELIVAGSFNAIEGDDYPGIAAFDGTDWRAITSNHTPLTSWDVWTMVEYNGELVIGGNFKYFDNVYSPSLVKWDGVTWSSMGAEIDTLHYLSLVSYVSILEVYNGDLYAGGKFTSLYGDGVIKWDGTSWSGLGSGVDNNGEEFRVYDISVHNSKLIVGGSFLNAGGILSERIAEWDGVNWNSIGIDGVPNVREIISFDNRMFAYSQSALHEYDNGAWVIVSGTEDFAVLYDTYELNNELVVAAAYPGFAGATDYLVKWDGTDWTTFDTYIGSGADAFIQDMVIYDNKLVCVGDFYKAGDEAFNDIAAWNGSSWESMNNEFVGWMNSAIVFNDELVVGAFIMFNNEEYDESRLMIYDGVSWSAINTTINTRIYDMAVYNGLLVIAGNNFIDGDGNEIHGLIAVNANHHIVPLGSGSLGPDYSTNTNNVVHSLAVFGGKLYAGGIFSYMDSMYIPKLAVYDGLEWQPVPGASSIVNNVYRMEVFNNELIVTGYFNHPEAERILKFDGSEWHSLPGGDVYGDIETMTVTPEFLIVGGNFTQAGGALANNCATWDGTCWGQLGDGINNKVMASAQYLGDYYFGGYFDQAGDVTSVGMAKYSGEITPCACCNGNRGNLDASANDLPDIVDLLLLVDYMFLPDETLDCLEEANIDGSVDGQVDITDLLQLVDYMFILGSPAPATCQ